MHPLYIINRSKREVPMETYKEISPHHGLEKYRDIIAAISSIIPGLGHIYKGHYRLGAGLLIVSPMFIWASLIMGFATAGSGLLVPFFFLMIIGWHAYSIEDRRKHPGGFI